MLAFQPLNRVTKETDCGLLQFSNANNTSPSATLSNQWSLPTNADEILDLAFARSTAGNGVAVLYKVIPTIFFRYSPSCFTFQFAVILLLNLLSQAQGNTRMLYSVYDADVDGWSVGPACPAGKDQPPCLPLSLIDM